MRRNPFIRIADGVKLNVNRAFPVLSFIIRTLLLKLAPFKLTQASGNMRHPYGEISVAIQRKGTAGIEAGITLPAKLAGKFVWNGKLVPLKNGTQKIPL